MDQASHQLQSSEDTASSGAADLVLQTMRLLVVVALLDVLIRRSSNAVLGIRLSAEHPWLRALNELGHTCERPLLNALLVGSLLLALSLSWAFWRRAKLRWRILAGALLGWSVWWLAWRLNPQLEWGQQTGQAPPTVIAAALCLGYVMAVDSKSPRPYRMISVGVMFALLWRLLISGLEQSRMLVFSDAASEILILVGITWLAYQSTQGILRRSRWSLLIGVGVAGAFFGLWARNGDAYRHITRHLFSVHGAGIPSIMTAALLSAALCGFVLLTFEAWQKHRGIGGRLTAPLWLLFVSARAAEPELLCLRVVAAAACLYVIVQDQEVKSLLKV